MRTPVRSFLATLVAAVALVTCSEAPTGPGPGSGQVAARVTLAPLFSSTARQAAPVLREAGITITSVKVRVTRPGTGDVLFERVIAVTPGESTMTLQVSLEIRSAQELLDASLEFRDAAGTVMYAAHQMLTVRQGENAAGDNPPFVVEFVGPGASATVLHLAPSDTAISTAAPLQMRATALDAAGAEMTGAIVAFASGDAALAIMSPTGLLTPTGLRGAVEVRVRTPTGLADTATVKLIPPPARLVVVGGDVQTGIVGTVLDQPFTVELQAADGLPAPGEAVTFSAVTSGGAVALATAITDAQGRASTPVRLGTMVGTYQFRAVSGLVPASTIAAKALAAAASKIGIVSGDAQKGEVATLLPEPLRVRVTDAFGNPVQNASVAWSVLEGVALLSAASTITDAAGKAQVALTLGTVTGTVKVVASLAATNALVPFTATALAAPATMIAIVQQPPAGAVNGVVFATAPRVQLANAYGPVAQKGRSVTASIDTAMSTSSTLSGTLTLLTDTTGAATFGDLVLTGQVGPVRIRFSADSLAPTLSDSLSLLPGAVASLVMRPAIPKTAIVALLGQPLTDPLWIEALDASGNRVPSAPVRFRIRDNITGAAVLDSTVQTDGKGEVPASSFPLPAVRGVFTVSVFNASALNAEFDFPLEVR